MKLSSPPTRYAFTSVIAAAMKYGPTHVSRIAYELDMPVETCRYYLKRFHNAGFRFLPVVDYRALGLQPCVLFIRFNKKLEHVKRENFLRWLDTVYTVYRAGLDNEHEYYLETVPPQGDVKILTNMLETLMDAAVLDNYNISEVNDGYYKPDWIKHYDFIRDCWGDEVEIDIPRIPLHRTDAINNFDLTDLLIISYLEENPIIKMKNISEYLYIPPQLISYHREKHIEGGRLITGYIPTRRTKHRDMQIRIITRNRKGHGEEFIHYLHSLTRTEGYEYLRVHTPVGVTLDLKDAAMFSINPLIVVVFTVPVEHYADKKWKGLENFAESLEKIIRVV